MKKYLPLFIIAAIFSSCLPKIIPVQNNYADLPYTTTTNSSFDQVWDKLIDMFAQYGLSIKLIDRSSGLIVSDNSAISATWEDKNGDLVHPDADIVVPKIKNNNLQSFVPFWGNYYNKADLKKVTIVNGEWNVRLKKNGDGTIINVNLVNVRYQEFDRVKKINITHNLSDFKSTGNFERAIAEAIQ